MAQNVRVNNLKSFFWFGRYPLYSQYRTTQLSNTNITNYICYMQKDSISETSVLLYFLVDNDLLTNS